MPCASRSRPLCSCAWRVQAAAVVAEGEMLTAMENDEYLERQRRWLPRRGAGGDVCLGFWLHGCKKTYEFRRLRGAEQRKIKNIFQKFLTPEGPIWVEDEKDCSKRVARFRQPVHGVWSWWANEEMPSNLKSKLMVASSRWAGSEMPLISFSTRKRYIWINKIWLK